MKTNVYVDGFNLYYGCLKGRPGKWLDLERLCAQLLPQDNIHRIRYFTALVQQRPGDPDPDVAKRQQVYLRALRTLPSVSIHLGRFSTKPTRMRLEVPPPPPAGATVSVWKTEEKGSDVNLATYMLVDAFRGDAETFVVVSNDSDLVEPLRILKHEEGKRVGLLNPQRTASWALAQCQPDFTHPIRAGVVMASQLPATLVDARGHKITKPAGW